MQYENNARLVPLPEVTRDSFTAFADSRWRFFQEHPAGTLTPYEKLWAVNPETGIYWVENELFGFNYIIVTGPQCKEVAAEISANIPHYDLARLQQDWQAAQGQTEALARLIKLAAFTADAQVYDAGFFELFEDAFDSPDVGLQRVGLIAAGSLPWQEFKPWYQKFARSSDELLKSLAEQAGLDLVLEESE